MVEEVSLFPLWFFKAAVVTNDDLLQLWMKGEVLSLFKFWYDFCKDEWVNGGLYEILYPYLCARILSHGDYCLSLSKRFADGYMSQFGYSSLKTSRKRKQFSANTLIMNRNYEKNLSGDGDDTGPSFDEEREQSSESSTYYTISKDKVEAILPPLLLRPGELLSRCARLTIAQPFYVTSLLMLCARISRKSEKLILRTRLPLPYKLSCRSTVFSLDGISAVLATCLLPVDFVYLGLGAADTLLNRNAVSCCPIETNGHRIKAGNNVFLLSLKIYPFFRVLLTGVNSLVDEGRRLVERHGVGGLFAYGTISCLQYIPGFFNFLCARIGLFLVAGPSSIRRLQLARRKAIVQNLTNHSTL